MSFRQNVCKLFVVARWQAVVSARNLAFGRDPRRSVHLNATGFVGADDEPGARRKSACRAQHQPVIELAVGHEDQPQFRWRAPINGLGVDEKLLRVVVGQLTTKFLPADAGRVVEFLRIVRPGRVDDRLVRHPEEATSAIEHGAVEPDVAATLAVTNASPVLLRLLEGEVEVRRIKRHHDTLRPAAARLGERQPVQRLAQRQQLHAIIGQQTLCRLLLRIGFAEQRTQRTLDGPETRQRHLQGALVEPLIIEIQRRVEYRHDPPRKTSLAHHPADPPGPPTRAGATKPPTSTANQKTADVEDVG